MQRLINARLSFATRYLPKIGLSLRAGIPGLTLASLLGVFPGFAIAQTPSQTNTGESQPVQVANIFRIIQDAVRTGEMINEALNGDQEASETTPQQQPSRSTPTHTEIRRPQPAQSVQRQPESPEEITARQQLLIEQLAKRNSETHEEWYNRVRPTVVNTPRADYQAWRASMSEEDRAAYDVIVRQRNHEAREQFNQMIPGIIEDAASSPERGNQVCHHNAQGRLRCYDEH